VDEVRSGSSYVSNNDMRVHLDLARLASRMGRSPLASGLTETFAEARPDSINTLKEGTGVARAKR
jgi:hypothetical protein